MSARFRGWGYDQRARHCLLLNREVTAARITDELASLKPAAELDLLLIYWAGTLNGHTRKTTLTSGDGNLDQSIAVDGLVEAIGSTPAKHRVLILDVCNASAAASQLGSLSRRAEAAGCVTVLAAGGTTPMEREDWRRGYFTGALLEQLPRDTRGLPPNIDLIHALRTGADHLLARRQEQPIVTTYGDVTELRLPLIGRTLPFETRARSHRPAARLIAAHQSHRKASA